MRGSRALRGVLDRHLGSIPAHAGQPRGQRRGALRARVDPRACGAAETRTPSTQRSKGRSPRMRGSPRASAREKVIRGSIPAHAGQPAAARVRPRAARVDPRACGAARGSRSKLARTLGRSPRMRGSPTPKLLASRIRRVDPRACGAALRQMEVSRWRSGRSPRMRGSRSRTSRSSLSIGSIPAHAGQPSPPVRCACVTRVDPRACGAAGRGLRLQRGGGGRSPRMRGSLRLRTRSAQPRGSIPAHAGQP